MSYIPINFCDEDGRRNCGLTAGVQGESGVNGLQFNIPEEYWNWSIVVDVENANGEKYQYEISDMINGVATYEFTSIDLKYKGKLKIDLLLINGSNIWKPFRGEFAVKESICAGGYLRGQPPVIMTSGIASTISGYENRIASLEESENTVASDTTLGKVKVGAGLSITEDGVLSADAGSGAAGQDGQDGQDGVSPVVSITEISGGNRVTITDAEHPNGQSFDVMDGESAQGGTRVNPDWCENDTASNSYINNRPFYDGGSETYPSTVSYLPVSDPSDDDLGKYFVLEDNEYIQTEDSEVDSEKTYYIKAGFVYDSTAEPDQIIEDTSPMFRIGDAVDEDLFVSISPQNIHLLMSVYLGGAQYAAQYGTASDFGSEVVVESGDGVQGLLIGDVPYMLNIPSDVDGFAGAGLYCVVSFGEESGVNFAAYITSVDIADIHQLDEKFIPETAFPSIDVEYLDQGSPTGYKITINNRGKSEEIYIYNGQQGENGQSGTTPVKGTDYWTASDIADIKAYCENAIANGAW